MPVKSLLPTPVVRSANLLKSACCIGLMALAWANIARADPLDASMAAFGVQQPRVHKLAPDFTLARTDGGAMALSDARGKVVVLHFWATWCVACRHEMPKIEQLWQRYRSRGLVVLGVNADRGNLPAVRDFIHQLNLSFPSLLAPDGAVRNTYGVRALPTSYLIGRDGKIIGRIIGERDWSSPAARAMMRTILKQGNQQ